MNNLPPPELFALRTLFQDSQFWDDPSTCWRFEVISSPTISIFNTEDGRFTWEWNVGAVIESKTSFASVADAKLDAKAKLKERWMKLEYEASSPAQMSL